MFKICFEKDGYRSVSMILDSTITISKPLNEQEALTFAYHLTEVADSILTNPLEKNEYRKIEIIFNNTTVTTKPLNKKEAVDFAYSLTKFAIELAYSLVQKRK